MVDVQRRSLQVMAVLAVFAFSTFARSQASDSEGAIGLHSAPAVVSEASDADEDADNHIELFQQARDEQTAYFNKMQADIANGVPVDAASGSCLYISAIFQPPPPKTVALTFDDGPTSALTPQVLQILKKHGLKATFFVKGDNSRANPKMIAQIHADGHLIGNHSYSHPNFHSISQASQVNEVTTTDSILNSVSASQGMKLFRYPYGNSTCSSNVLVRRQLGYTGIVGWHVDSCDWAYARTGTVTVAQARTCEVAPGNRSNLVAHVIDSINKHNGGVILLHEIHQFTVRSLDEIIVRLQQAGYKFTTLDDPRMARYFQ